MVVCWLRESIASRGMGYGFGIEPRASGSIRTRWPESLLACVVGRPQTANVVAVTDLDDDGDGR
jgi:hypothetical protein